MVYGSESDGKAGLVPQGSVNADGSLKEGIEPKTLFDSLTPGKKDAAKKRLKSARQKQKESKSAIPNIKEATKLYESMPSTKSKAAEFFGISSNRITKNSDGYTITSSSSYTSQGRRFDYAGEGKSIRDAAYDLHVQLTGRKGYPSADKISSKIKK